VLHFGVYSGTLQLWQNHRVGAEYHQLVFIGACQLPKTGWQGRGAQNFVVQVPKVGGDVRV